MVLDRINFQVYINDFILKYKFDDSSKDIQEKLNLFKEYVDQNSVLTYGAVKEKVFQLFPLTPKLAIRKSDKLRNKILNDITESYSIKKKEIKNALPKGAKLIYQCVVGSQSFGLATPTSDLDVKGVYVQPDVYHSTLDNDYAATTVVNKDETYFEIKRYMELLLKGEAIALEMLFAPRECVTILTPEFKYIHKYKSKFVTQRLYYSFYNYAVKQFKKATNYNKMANWDESRTTRQPISSFCKFMDRSTGKTFLFTDYITENGIDTEDITLTKLDGFVNGFKVYNYRTRGWFTENSNEVRTGKIPKEIVGDWIGVIYFNHMEYSEHCRDFGKYQEWLTKRSEERYNTNKNHGQKYDAKNIMHTVRLIMTAMEIPRDKTINVKRDSERDYLLSIKRGEIDLETELNKWLEISVNIKDDFDSSDLPLDTDPYMVNHMLYKIRVYQRVGKKKVLSKPF